MPQDIQEPPSNKSHLVSSNDEPEEEKEPESKNDDNDEEEVKSETTTFSSDCYDVMTERDGQIYIFKSKRPLEEGVNPKIFSDLPTYRVWSEHMLYEGIRCPILNLDPKDKNYKHPEEKYPQEVPMVVSNIAKGQRRKYEATISYQNSTGFTEKPYLVHTPTNVHNYEHDLYKTPMNSNSNSHSLSRQSNVNEDFRNHTRNQKNSSFYDSSTDPSRYIAHDDLILRSQHEGLDLGMDQSLPITPRNFRDIPKKKILRDLVKTDPSLKGAKLTRTGTSKYEVSEIQLEPSCEDPINDSSQGYMISKQVPIDLLAYGGTLVPSGSIHGIF